MGDTTLEEVDGVGVGSDGVEIGGDGVTAAHAGGGGRTREEGTKAHAAA